jgi:hypothetical protein
MLQWPGGGFSLDEGILPHKKTVEATWEQLLFEGARRADLGTNRPTKAIGPTITTAEPMTIRMYDSQPKLTITRPDLPEVAYNLEQEYTHVGRAQGNEICLPYPSISNRHCIFIHSGPDIVLRDLNCETVLRPGDTVQCGVVFMKFEPGVKRPKLTAPEKPTSTTKEPMGQLKTQATTGTIYYQTARLPNAPIRPRSDGKARAKEDSVYVKGESAISYDDLPKPEVKKTNLLKIAIIVLIALLPVVAGACYYFLVMNHGGH